MDQVIKQRPCVVIGTYDSYHHNNLYQMMPKDTNDQSGSASTVMATTDCDPEQSTDLFSYCRSSQLSSSGHFSFNLKKNLNQIYLPTKLKLRLNLDQIKGPTGSVRGHKDVVRKSLENIRAIASISSKRNFNSTHFQSFKSLSQQQQQQDGYSSLACCSSLMMQMDEQHKAEYLERLIEDELGQCVAYTTTLGVIRRTFEDSKLMKSILNSNLIKYEERDIYLNQEYKRQLRLRCNAIQIPVLFVDGNFFGGIKEVELMNEDGTLAKQLAQFKMSEAPRHVCYCCGNAKFIACQSCNGSRKSAVHHFKYNSIALRCIKCDKNDGLVECPVCSSFLTTMTTTSTDSPVVLNEASDKNVTINLQEGSEKMITDDNNNNICV